VCASATEGANALVRAVLSTLCQLRPHRPIIPYPYRTCFRGGFSRHIVPGYDRIVPPGRADRRVPRTLQICNLHLGDGETMIRPEHFI
jgi:hypothetical protein